MQRAISASVIIPTYKRVECLLDTLNAVAAQNVAPATFEIVVVDNNSQDNTPDVVAEFAQTHPNLCVRYICETKPGVSNARNRGVAESRGEILCFLDNDSPPLPEWLAELLAGIAAPAIGCVGGPSRLDYRGQRRPVWLLGDLEGLLSGYGLPYDKPTQVSDLTEMPLGCNMAFKRQVFAELGGFRTDVDRIGDKPLAAGETDMIYRAHLAGWKVVYLPNAIVHHIVAPNRLEKPYLFRIGDGLAESFVILTSSPSPVKFLRWLLSDVWYATRMFLALLTAFVSGKATWFDDYVKFWIIARRIPIRLRRIGQWGVQPASPIFVRKMKRA